MQNIIHTFAFKPFNLKNSLMFKRASLILLCVILFNNAFAQELVNKKGTPILPKKGEWGIGFDVVPILKYAGNIFYDADNNSDLSINYPLSITARYLHTENTAYRFLASVGFMNTKTDTLVPKQGSTNTNEQVADETVDSKTSTLLGFGIQKWFGKSRVRGYYGGEAGFTLKTAKTKYDFGNELGAQNPVNERTILNKQGTTFGIGMRGFLGVEVYVAPRISLSAEYGYSPLVITTTKANEIKSEKWDGSSVVTETSSTKGKVNTVASATDNHNGSISLLFYFSR